MQNELIEMLCIAAIFMLLFGTYYYIQPNKSLWKALIWKGGATFMAVLCALYSAVVIKSPESVLIFLAAFCCMAADVLLQNRFEKGVLVFGIGHLFYMAGYLVMIRPNLFSAVCFVCLLGAMLWIYRNHLPFLKKRKILGILYAVLLCGMTSLAIALAVERRDAFSGMIAAGGIFFFLSDNILISSILGKCREKSYSSLLLILYYAAVYFISISFYFL